MANKAQIKAQIQASLTLNPSITTRAVHEEYLHTEASSFLESIYMDEVLDNEATSVIFNKITLSNCTYSLRVIKQGRKVTVNGVVNALQSPLDQFANIVDLEYLPVQNVRFINSAKVYITQGAIDTGESVSIGINRPGANAFITAGGIMNGESVRFQFTYNTED